MKDKLILIIAIIFFALTVLLIGTSAHGASTVRYLNKTIDVDSTQSIKFNTKVELLKSGKKYSTITYAGNTYEVRTEYLSTKKAVNKWPGKKFKRRGRGKWNKCSWTWYSQRVLPGRGLKIPGRHVDKKRGFVLDRDGYICLASGRKNKKKKVIGPPPFGRYGKVYDTNGRNNNKWFDVYTNW